MINNIIAKAPTVFKKNKVKFNEAAQNVGLKDLKGDIANMPVEVFESHDYQQYVPVVDKSFVLPEEQAKNIAVILMSGGAMMTYGMHGTGKTMLYTLMAAITNRPLIRTNHTFDMDRSDVLGQTLVKDKQTYFNPGFLPIAMRYGFLYLADEYDAASPGVSLAYQQVTEGSALTIAGASDGWEVIAPHEEFRFMATGNTNGTGDDVGLYVGTIQGNAANYSRFKIVQKMEYPEPKIEQEILKGKTGIKAENASKMVQFANMCRKAFERGEISMPIGQRELLNCVEVSAYRASFRKGVQLAYANRANKEDQNKIMEFFEQVFGKEE